MPDLRRTAPRAGSWPRPVDPQVRPATPRGSQLIRSGRRRAGATARCAGRSRPALASSPVSDEPGPRELPQGPMRCSHRDARRTRQRPNRSGLTAAEELERDRESRGATQGFRRLRIGAHQARDPTVDLDRPRHDPEVARPVEPAPPGVLQRLSSTGVELIRDEHAQNASARPPEPEALEPADGRPTRGLHVDLVPARQLKIGSLRITRDAVVHAELLEHRCELGHRHGGSLEGGLPTFCHVVPSCSVFKNSECSPYGTR
jgi:hypothetical protein